MTEKEFENLKVGDKVWIIPWFKGESVFQGTIGIIGHYNKNVSNKWVSVEENKAYTYSPENVFQTKVEALQQVVKTRETSVIASRSMLQSDEDELAEAKKELAKAKEEESGWVIINEHIYNAFPSDCYRGLQKYATEQEAHEALAEYYKGKYEEELAKSGKARFIIRCGDKVCLVQDVEDFDGEKAWCRNYYGFWNLERKDNVFNSRQEAEAEVERRKK